MLWPYYFYESKRCLNYVWSIFLGFMCRDCLFFPLGASALSTSISVVCCLWGCLTGDASGDIFIAFLLLYKGVQ